jgi:ABC-2 type transport system permease protein
MIRALVQKDILLFFRNKFFALLTVLGVAAYVIVYLVMPSTADDQLGLALYVENASSSPLASNLADNLQAKLIDTQDALVEDVKNGTYVAGVALSADNLAAVQRGDSVSIPVYYAPSITQEMSAAVTDILTVAFNNMSLSSGAENIHINEQVDVLGADLSGIVKPLPLRDRMLPTFLLLIMTIETMGLATLIVEEVENHTAEALLVTPLTTGRFFLSKATMGVGLAFVQVFVLVVLTGRIATSPLIVTAALLVGSILMTGVAFLIASVAKDMLSSMAWGILGLIILAMPAIIVVFPSIASDWIRIIPSYYLVDTLHRTMNFGAGWSDVLPNLLVLLVFGLAVLGAGSLVLRRRFQ